MRRSDAERAVRAACRIAASLGLATDDTVILHDSNKLTLRLLPCDVLARVAPVDDQVAEFELGLARRLVEVGAPVAAPAPEVGRRVYERDGFAITLWTYHAPSDTPLPASDYAEALADLHASLRRLDFPAPHFTDRVAQAQSLLADTARTPDLAAADRELLSDTLRRLGQRVGGCGADEQLLHGEPHPGNVLATKDAGPLFVDLETVCRGPIEFDLAHAPDEVAAHYPGVDDDLLHACRTLVLAIVTTWRWDRDDRFPDGRRMGREWLARLSGRRGRS
ncbi:phosphotransferase [Streptomyces sp. NPDC006422]|uniref:phosphotransferase enzyme family protein n=1 Tax=unclassified Streptomyces TaxID=2593676 RepID=UPI0033A4B10A